MNPRIDPIIRICNCLITFGIKPTRISIKSLPQGLFLVLKFKGNRSRMIRIYHAVDEALKVRFKEKVLVERINSIILVSLKKG